MQKEPERDIEQLAEDFEHEAGIFDLLTAYDQAEIAYARVAPAEETSIVSYSVSSQPMVSSKVHAG